MSPSASKSHHDSAIRPSSIRAMPMPVMVTVSPVGGMPWNSPSCVPPAVTRSTTLSPSAMTSWIASSQSGNAAANISTMPLWPSRSMGSGAPGKWAA